MGKLSRRLFAHSFTCARASRDAMEPSRELRGARGDCLSIYNFTHTHGSAATQHWKPLLRVRARLTSRKAREPAQPTPCWTSTPPTHALLPRLQRRPRADLRYAQRRRRRRGGDAHGNDSQIAGGGGRARCLVWPDSAPQRAVQLVSSVAACAGRGANTFENALPSG